MTVMKRWFRSKRNQVVIFIFLLLCLAYYLGLQDLLPYREPNLDLTRRTAHVSVLPAVVVKPAKQAAELNLKYRPSVHKFIESRLQEALKEDKGSGCEIPSLDPYAKEVTQFDKERPKVVCTGPDWVKCYHSECKIIPEVLARTHHIKCVYNDIIYESDQKYHIGPSNVVLDGNVYKLTDSDHIKISCTGIDKKKSTHVKWNGFSTGFRTTVDRKPVPSGREDSLNVLIFGYDSTSKNGFIRRLPQSYKYITEVMKFTVLNGYNIVGDGTPAALFPILTGKTELELPDVRKSTSNNGTLDVMPFIFYKLKDDGYRTAYFEDMPWIGTFQYRFNGFRHQPADHYLRDFYLEHESCRNKKWLPNEKKYCLGDTPQYKVMMNITEQFLHLDGKKFIFTFVADITHDDLNMIATADDDMVDFLEALWTGGIMENTLIMIMSDHGPRFANVRDTLQGKQEERLPFMAIHLPEVLKRRRPGVQAALEANVQALTTPHDIHAMILDVLDMPQHYNPYKVAGADLPRGMTLLEPIPRNRSCSEAGIEPHWCACLMWKNVTENDPLYQRTVDTFINYINSLTENVRSQCVIRTITEVKWVMRQYANKHMLLFDGAKDADGYVGKFKKDFKYTSENYQIKVVVRPGRGVYEASMKYLIYEDRFIINIRDISRTNEYGQEPSCISAKHPHLNPYCYCNDYVSRRI